MLSFPEILVILLVAVIVLGPKRLPETARKIGRWVGILKQASESFKRELMSMDRMVDDSLNRAVSDIDQLKPDALASYEQVEAELVGTFNEAFGPPPMTPDEVLAQNPIPGGLPPEPSPSPAPASDAALPPEPVVAVTASAPVSPVEASVSTSEPTAEEQA